MDIRSSQTLPRWMHEARRGNDWALLLVICVALLFALSLTRSTSLASTNDLAAYLAQGREISTAFAEGRFPPRWSADSLAGLGAPIYQYTPPGAAILIGFVDTFLVANPLLALRVVLIAAWVLGAIGLYGFLLIRVDARAGLIGSLLYLFSPMFARTAPLLLGDVPTVLGMALLPCLLWALQRATHPGRPLSILLSVLTGAWLLITQPLYFIFGLLLIEWIWVQPPPRISRQDAAIRLHRVLLVSVLFSAWFWLPALFERGFISWQFIGLPVDDDALLWQTLWNIPTWIEQQTLIALPAFSLGLAIPFANSLSTLYFLRHPRESLPFLAYFLIGLFLIIFALLGSPGDVSLLGLITLAFAISGGTGAVWFNIHTGPSQVALGGIIVTVVFLHLALWWPLHSPAPLTVDDTPLMPIPEGNALPTSLQGTNLEQPLPTFAQQLATRLDYATQPALTLVERQSHHSRFLVNTSETEPAIVRFQRAYFPGWRINSENGPIPAMQDPATGVVMATIPPNTSGFLELSLHPTRLRWIANALSIVGFLSLCLLVLVALRTPDTIFVEDHLLPRTYRPLVISLISFFAILRLISLQSIPSTQTQNLDEPIFQAIGGIKLIEVETFVQNADGIDLVLTWVADNTPQPPFTTRLAVRDERGQIVRIETPQQPGGFSPDRWVRNTTVADRHRIRWVEPLTPGRYQVFVQLCLDNCETILTLTDRQNQPLNRPMPISSFEVLR